jgi:hypothetical protein
MDEWHCRDSPTADKNDGLLVGSADTGVEDGAWFPGYHAPQEQRRD